MSANVSPLQSPISKNSQGLEIKSKLRNNSNLNHTTLGFIDKNPISVKEVVNSFSRKNGSKVFGIDGYELPSTNRYFNKPLKGKISKSNAPDFMDIETKQKLCVPGYKYETVQDWSKVLPKKGHFTKSPRVTMTEAFILEEQRRPKPSPNEYFKDPSKKKKINFFIGKDDKTTIGFLDAQARASNSPGNKYNPNYKRVDKDLRSFSITKSKISRSDKIQKDLTKPGPGDYDTPGSYNKTQICTKGTTLSKGAIKNFVDQAAYDKKLVPSSDTYNVTNDTMNRLSKSPTSLRKHK